MNKLAIVLVMLLVSTVSATWILPTSYSDPNNKWSTETKAYDGNMVTRASHTSALTSGNYLILFHTGVTDCNKVRLYIRPKTDQTGEIDVNYSGDWHNVFTGTLVNGWNICEIGSSQTVVAIRFAVTSVGTHHLYEAHFWQASTAPPTKVTNISPIDDAVDQPLITKPVWSLGALLDTDNYLVYLGTDNPPTNIVNGESASISITPTAETYNPYGLPPSTEYFWRIDAVNDNDVNAGDVWSFTTRAGYKILMPH